MSQSFSFTRKRKQVAEIGLTTIQRSSGEANTSSRL